MSIPYPRRPFTTIGLDASRSEWDEMADQKTSSIISEGPPKGASRLHEDSPLPELVQLVRLLARSAAKEAFEASLIKPTDANDAKN